MILGGIDIRSATYLKFKGANFVCFLMKTIKMDIMKTILMYMVFFNENHFNVHGFFNQQISVLVCIVAGYTGPYGLYWAAVGCSGL